jgi:hypothetical protein
MEDGPAVRPVRRRADPCSGPTRPPPGVEYLGPIEYVSWQAIGSSSGSVPARGARRPRRHAARSRFAATAPCAPKVAAAGAQPTGNASELQSAPWIRAPLPCALIVLKPRAVPCPASTTCRAWLPENHATPPLRAALRKTCQGGSGGRGGHWEGARPVPERRRRAAFTTAIVIMMTATMRMMPIALR